MRIDIGEICITLANYFQEDIQPAGVTTTRYVVLNGEYLAKEVQQGSNPAQKYFYHVDRVGSVRAITDSQGQVVARFEYEPFGVTSSVSGPLGSRPQAGGEIHKFTGKPEDAAVGLYYFNARYYDPASGRFVSRDLVNAGLNAYVYVDGNPMIHVDPNGLHKVTVINGQAALVLEYQVNGQPEVPIDVISSFDPKLKPHAYAIIAYTMYTTGDSSLGPGDALLIPSKYVPNVTAELNAVLENEAARAQTESRKGLVSRVMWLIEQAQSGGPWDLKSKSEWQYRHFVYGDMVIDRDAPGNMLYGYAGAALAIPRELLLAGAGAYQVLSGTSYIGWYRSFFDDPRDQKWISFGTRMCEHMRAWKELIW